MQMVHAYSNYLDKHNENLQPGNSTLFQQEENALLALCTRVLVFYFQVLMSVDLILF